VGAITLWYGNSPYIAGGVEGLYYKTGSNQTITVASGFLRSLMGQTLSITLHATFLIVAR
jgi:hypothetical protein